MALVATGCCGVTLLCSTPTTVPGSCLTCTNVEETVADAGCISSFFTLMVPHCVGVPAPAVATPAGVAAPAPPAVAGVGVAGCCCCGGTLPGAVAVALAPCSVAYEGGSTLGV